MANHSIKIHRAIANSGIFKGETTIREVMKNVPQSAIEKLSSKELTEIINALSTAFHEGKNFEYKELEENGFLRDMKEIEAEAMEHLYA